MHHDEIQEVIFAIRSKTSFVPKLGIICGSGLGGLADQLDGDTKKVISYKDIDGFPECTGELKQKQCTIMIISH